MEQPLVLEGILRLNTQDGGSCSSSPLSVGAKVINFEVSPIVYRTAVPPPAIHNGLRYQPINV